MFLGGGLNVKNINFAFLFLLLSIQVWKNIFIPIFIDLWIYTQK